MEYEIKGYLIGSDNKTLDCRITVKTENFAAAVEFLSRVSLEAYDVIKVLPVM